MKIPEPIRSTTFTEMVNSWSNICKYGESGSIYFYSKADFLRRFNQLDSDPVILKKFFSKRDLFLFDIESLVIEDIDDLHKALSRFVSGKKPNLFFVLGLDDQLRQKNNHFFSMFQDVESQIKDQSFIFVFNMDFTHPDYRKLLNLNSTFLQNTFLHPLYSNKDSEYFIHYLTRKWKLNIRREIMDQIIENCSGHFWLIKEAIRYIRDNSTNDIEEIFWHEQMQIRYQSIWDQFLPSEKNVINGIIKANIPSSENEIHSLNFLLKTKWLNINKSQAWVSIPLLEQYIKKQIWKLVYEHKNGHLYLNGVVIESSFSPKEKQLLTFFIDNQNKEISRDQISDNLSINEEEPLSNWAIDQLISRLRKKLKLVGSSVDTIRTLKNKGYIFIQNT